MTDTFRALCAELLVFAEESISYRAQVSEAVQLIDRARAALAEPEPQGDLIPDRYSGYQKTIYRDGFHAGYKHGLNSASAALAQSEPEPPAS